MDLGALLACFGVNCFHTTHIGDIWGCHTLCQFGVEVSLEGLAHAPASWWNIGPIGEEGE